MQPPPADYFRRHRALVPDDIDPAQSRVSVGDFGGQPQQFGIAGDADPSKVAMASGLGKWDLVSFDYVLKSTGKSWVRRTFAADIEARTVDANVQGSALLQVMTDRQLKFEVFPGKARRAGGRIRCHRCHLWALSGTRRRVEVARRGARVEVGEVVARHELGLVVAVGADAADAVEQADEEPRQIELVA